MSNTQNLYHIAPGFDVLVFPLRVLEANNSSICGLSTAIGLRRAGHHVTVYEKYSAEADAGAGIVVCPNATRVLKQWGLDLEDAGMLKYQAGYVLDGKSLEVLDVIFGDGSRVNKEEDNGESQYMATRHDLRMLLRKEAERAVLGRGTIEFRYGMEVVDYDADRPAMKLADATWVDADLVVACDGIKSKAARVVCDGENPAKATGRSAFRLLIPDEELRAVKEKFRDNELIRDKFDKSKGIIWFTRQTGRLMVWWTCRFGEMHAFDVLVPDNEKYTSKEDWTAKSEKRVLLEEFAKWHPLFRDILEAANDDPLLWKVCTREPLETLHKGKLCMYDFLIPVFPHTSFPY